MPTTQAAQNPRVAQFIRPDMGMPNLPNMPAMPSLGVPQNLDVPAYARQRKVASGGAFPLVDDDIINIPAFLRNQAD